MRENIGGARTVVMVAQPCSERNATRAGNVRKSLSSGAVEGQWSRVKRSLARGFYLAERTIRDAGMFCSCSCSISLLRRQVRSRYCRFPSIQAIVWSAKLGTCNRSCNRLGTVLVLAEAGREYVKTAVLVCKAQSLLWATPLRGHMYRKAERSLGQQMQGSRCCKRPASSQRASPCQSGLGWIVSIMSSRVGG